MARRYTFWVDALLVVVTLGLYAPFWLWRRNEDLRADFPTMDLPGNGPLVLAGVVCAALSPAEFVFDAGLLGKAVNAASVLLIAGAVFVLASNGEAVAEAHRASWRMAPALVSGLFAGAFLCVLAGDVFPAMSVRGLALLLLASLPFVFYYVHEDLEGAHRSRDDARRAAPPPPLTS
jgi:hypothetical protein